jgi:Fe-S-cluster containining protein
MKALLLYLLLFFPFLLSAQDLTGFWKGKLTQDSGGYAPEYVLEVNIVQKKNNLYGNTLAYSGTTVVSKIAFNGYIDADSIYLREDIEGVMKKVYPQGFGLCIKNLILKYKKESGGLETLTGRWDGKPIEKLKKEEKDPDAFSLFTKSDGDCIPGYIFLSKNDLAHIYTSKPTQYQVFPDSIYQTKINNIEEIDVFNQIVQISIADYEKVDGDKVTIMLNQDTVASKVSVRRVPKTYSLVLNSVYVNNQLLIYAENLGKIPPNTCGIKIIDGDKIHLIYLSSDFRTTGAIKLNYIGNQKE